MRRNYFAAPEAAITERNQSASQLARHPHKCDEPLGRTIHCSMLERCVHLAGARTAHASFPARGMKRPRAFVACTGTTAAAGALVEVSRRCSSTAQQPPTPVAIVGAGPAGLTMSCLLSQFGVPSILLEKAPALPTHPQAHFINLRSMEIMRHALGGLDRAVLERCPPRDEWRWVRFGSQVTLSRVLPSAPLWGC